MDEREPTIIEILDEEMKKGCNDPENYPSVVKIAQRMGISPDVLQIWLTSDREFVERLTTVKETHDNDPWKDTTEDEAKLDAAVLSFGVAVVLEETKKRYTV